MATDSSAVASPSLAEIDSVLFDCDGVIWRGTDPVPGATDTISALRAAGKKVFFVSNNSTKARATYLTKLTGMGIEAEADEVVSSAFATAQYLIDSGLKAGDKVYVVGMDGLHTELGHLGIETLGADDHTRDVRVADFSLDLLDRDVKAVVCGMDERITYFKLCMAVAYLRNVEGCRFVATNGDLTFPGKDTILPGGGTIVRAVAQGSEREPELVVGKPNLAMLEILERTSGVDRSRSMMVGDRLNTDVAFGNAGGLQTVLVLTGVSSQADADALEAGHVEKPDVVVPSIATLQDWL